MIELINKNKDINLKGTGHQHKNKKTLDGFWCESLETGFSFDISSDALKWNGKPIAFSGFTATISKIEPTTNEDGNPVFRVWLCWGDMAYNAPTEYFDIPVAEVKKTETISGGIITNGSELVLNGGSIDTDNFVTDGELWALEEELNAFIYDNMEEVWQEVNSIKGGIDEIETLIDESGVLE